MKRLSSEARRILLHIYIGQNIRDEGILQSEIRGKEEVQLLLTEGFVKENHWHLDQFLTTEKGNILGKRTINKRIEASKSIFREKIKIVPNKVAGFFAKRYIAENLAFPAEKEYFDLSAPYSSSWRDTILADGRIWILWNEFFESLLSLGLCVKTHDYVSTRGGETRYYHYVISPEVRGFLTSEFNTPDFTSSEERTMTLYPFLIAAKRILATDDVELARQRYFQSLKFLEVTENQVAGIINEMNRQKITSEYRGLLSEWKPFEIMNSTKYVIYLHHNIIEPAIKILLEGKGSIKEYHAEEKMPTLPEIKSELGLLDERELGDFYVMVSFLERQIRDFIKEKLDKGWEKRIENEVPKVYESWTEKKERDNRWGIEPEKDLINYSDLGDYISIVKQYPRIFSDGIEDMGDILTHLKIWYNHGRNPIMHSRTVNKQKLYTTKSAVDFLSEWMRRKR